MNRITRESFIDTMGGDGNAGIDPSSLAPAARAALERAGITGESLAEIAGGDARINGREELSRLFDLIDRVDRNGSRNSIATSARSMDGRAMPTLSGAAAEALRDEIDRARVNRDARGTIAPRSEGSYEGAVGTLEAAGLTDIHLARSTPYYRQHDQRWFDHPYPKTPPVPGVRRTLAEAGCAPCAFAMADATLRGTRTTPIDVADFAVAGGFSGSPSGFGTDTKSLGKAWAAAHDLTFTFAHSSRNSDNVDAILEGLEAGGVAVISVGIDARRGLGHFTAHSHVMLVNGCARDADGKEWFFLANPGRENQVGSHELKTDDTVKQDLSLDPAAGRLRISRDQLEAELHYACILQRRV